MSRKVVYISGPLESSGDPSENVARANDIMIELIHAGFAPINPFLSWLLDPGNVTCSRDEWLDVDCTIVRKCDVLLRIPGYSVGAEMEVYAAWEAGIPVVHSVDELVKLMSVKTF